MGSPSDFSRSGADQSSDSPTGSLLSGSASTHKTLRPARERCIDAAMPARPPPITVTSIWLTSSCVDGTIHLGKSLRHGLRMVAEYSGNSQPPKGGASFHPFGGGGFLRASLA